MSALTVDVPFGWALIVVGLFWLLAVPAFIGVAAAMAAGSKPRPRPVQVIDLETGEDWYELTAEPSRPRTWADER